jgi:uncharacterized protein (TIGR02996 family)
MNTHRQFFELIRQNPEDDTPRLIYADWLDELGDPRGEFIRVQCELAMLSHSDWRWELLKQREEALLKEFHAAWIRPLASLHFNVLDAKYRRGFLEKAQLVYWKHPGDLPPEFTARWQQLIEREPGLSVVGLAFEKDWHGIELTENTPQLRSLHFNYQALARPEVSQILRWPTVRNLRALDLSHNNLRSGVEGVARAPSLDNLQELDLSFNQIGNRGARVLASSSYLQGLKRLNLRGNHIGRFGKEKLREAFSHRVQL